MMWLLFYFPLRLELFAEPLTYNDSHCIDKIDFSPSLGVHPNRNTATVFLAFSDLESLIRSHGNSVSFVAI